MKVKLLDIVNSNQVLNKLLNSNKMPVKEAYMLSRSVKKIQEELTEFDNVRVKLVKELGEKTEGDNYIIKQENEGIFREKIDEILNTEIEVNITKIGIDKLDGLGLSPIELLYLDYLIEASGV